MMLRKFAVAFGLLAILAVSCSDDDSPSSPPPPPGPNQVTLKSAKDNTLYEPAPNEASNGAGIEFYVGKTAGPYGSSGQVRIRRGLLQFDIAASGIPPNSTIDSVELEVEVTRIPTGSGAPARHAVVGLHRALSSWGEGSSAGTGGGAFPTPGGATWTYSYWDTTFWTNPGGDFDPTSSAGVLVDGMGIFKWGSTSGMVADVQTWLDDPASNHGWVLVGGEAATDTLTAKGFATRENQAAGDKSPRLKIYYTEP